MVRRLTLRVLQGAGYEVLTASNGAEALQLFDDAGVAVDLVVSDVVMPVMGGHELIKHIRERQPDMPVVLTSGYAEHGNDQDKVLRKPYSNAALLEKVRTLLDQRRSSGS